MNVYSILDRKARQFGQLMLDRNDFAIQRGLADGIKREQQSTLGLHPDDFDLYQVGEFDDESGLLLGTVPPRLVVCVEQLVLPAKQGEQLSLLKEG